MHASLLRRRRILTKACSLRWRMRAIFLLCVLLLVAWLSTSCVSITCGFQLESGVVLLSAGRGCIVLADVDRCHWGDGPVTDSIRIPERCAMTIHRTKIAFCLLP